MVDFNRALGYECNGTYKQVALAQVPVATSSTQLRALDRTYTVVDPAPDVAPPTATVAESDRSVAVAWTPLPNPPKDFRGYVVLRTARRATTERGREPLPAGQTTWTDTDPPAAGGAFTYQVRTRRAGADPRPSR